MERQLCECNCGGYAKLNYRGKPNKYIRGHARKGKTKYPEQLETPPLCKCPCEKPVKWSKDKKRWNTYLTGHNNRTYKKVPRQSKYPPLCKCGCKEPVKWNKGKKRWNVYLSGHNVRGKPRPNKGKSKYDDIEQVPTLCDCGCQGLVKWVNGKPNKYLPGHNNRGKKMPPCKQETKDKIGDANRGKKRSQEIKDMISENMIELWKDPEYKSDMIDSHNECWFNQVNRDRQSEKTIERFEDPKEREKTSLGVKKYIKDNDISFEGENNNMYGKTLSEEHKAILLKALTGREVSGETRIKLSCRHQKISRDEWVDFIAQEPYCSIWTKEFKEMIKERDGYKCLNPDCWKTSTKLCGHHVDYNKKNCNPWNIITTCLSCNSRANKNRSKWQKFYQEITNEKHGYKYE